METPLEFGCRRRIIEIAKRHLEMLEDIESSYNDAQNALLDTIKLFNIDESQKQLLTQIIISSCLFTENRKAQLRKRTLDYANTMSRELSEEFKKYTITL